MTETNIPGAIAPYGTAVIHCDDSTGLRTVKSADERIGVLDVVLHSDDWIAQRNDDGSIRLDSGGQYVYDPTGERDGRVLVFQRRMSKEDKVQQIIEKAVLAHFQSKLDNPNADALDEALGDTELADDKGFVPSHCLDAALEMCGRIKLSIEAG